MPKHHHRRLPAPRAPRPPQVASPPTPDPTVAPEVVQTLISLQQEVCRASGKSTFVVWRDWLLTLAPWLAVVGQQGELAAQAALPPEVAELYTQLEERYTTIAGRYPAAPRTMKENFLRMWQLLNQHYPRFDPNRFGTWPANPDLLGQAFLTSLGRPAAWAIFFPPWREAVSLARQLIPDGASRQIYDELAAAHLRVAVLREQPVEKPQPGDDDSWLRWLGVILPHANLPLLMAEEITSVTLLPALAGRFSPWLVRGSGLVQFAWPRLAADPVLDSICAINAMLMGLNGFYLHKYVGDAVAIEQIRQALADPDALPALDPPPHAPFAAEPPDPPAPPDPDLPSFSELFRRPPR